LAALVSEYNALHSDNASVSVDGDVEVMLVDVEALVEGATVNKDAASSLHVLNSQGQELCQSPSSSSSCAPAALSASDLMTDFSFALRASRSQRSSGPARPLQTPYTA
jgi:hypothetical protein